MDKPLQKEIKVESIHFTSVKFYKFEGMEI